MTTTLSDRISFELMVPCAVVAPIVGVSLAQDLGALSGADARDVTSEGVAFVELEADGDSYFVQEPIQVTISFGFDDQFLRENLIQLFRQKLDVPVQLDAPWLPRLAGTTPIDSETEPDPDRRVARFALGGAIAEATRVDDRVQNGRRYRVFSVERRFLAERPGDLALAAPVVRFAYATEFADSLLSGRTAANRVDAFVTGAGLALPIRALPEAEQPIEFTGAVGSFRVDATAQPQEVRVGETFELSLRITGAGNIGFFRPPSLDDIDGFRSLGQRVETTADGLLVVIDLTPTDLEVREVPPLPFVYFDPEPPAMYRTVATVPIPIAVESQRDAAPSVAPVAVESSPSETDKPDEPWFEPLPTLVGIVVSATVVAFLAARARTRRRARPEDGPRAAAADFRARIAQPGEDLTDALTELLAARLRCAPAAVIGPDLARRLEADGVPPPIAMRATKLLEALVAARYGGTAPPDGAEAAAELAEQLARA